MLQRCKRKHFELFDSSHWDGLLQCDDYGGKAEVERQSLIDVTKMYWSTMYSNSKTLSELCSLRTTVVLLPVDVLYCSMWQYILCYRSFTSYGYCSMYGVYLSRAFCTVRSRDVLLCTGTCCYLHLPAQ